MKKSGKVSLIFGAGMLILFAVWTIMVCFANRQSIGPEGSAVGFADINGFVHKAFGVNMFLYTVTDWLGLVPVFIAAGFGLLGLVQWIKRKNILKVDFSVLILGVFYIVVFFMYFFFEEVIINYRPVLIEGVLEASYPSSTTLLVLCVMPTALVQFRFRIKNKILRRIICVAIILFSLFMVVGRLLSGVHWLTDIVGGVILSTGLVFVYYGICEPFCKK